MTTYATFDVYAMILDERLLKQLKRELPTTDSIVGALGFSETSVNNNRDKCLGGVFVVTGPEAQTHVFINTGLTRKYRGTLVQGQSMVQLGKDLSHYVMKKHQPLYHDFRNLCNDVHRALTNFAKTQLEQKL